MSERIVVGMSGGVGLVRGGPPSSWSRTSEVDGVTSASVALRRALKAVPPSSGACCSPEIVDDARRWRRRLGIPY
jgi:tRNA U34 2-thiouridine synthase MnmA/TrmU